MGSPILNINAEKIAGALTATSITVFNTSPSNRMRNPSLAHGITTLYGVANIIDTNTLNFTFPAGAAAGGSYTVGLSNSSAIPGLAFWGIPAAALGTSAAVIISASKKNSTATQALASTEKLFALENAVTANNTPSQFVFTVLGNGSTTIGSSNSPGATLQVDGTIKNGQQTIGNERVNLTGGTILSAVTASTLNIGGSAPLAVAGFPPFTLSIDQDALTICEFNNRNTGTSSRIAHLFGYSSTKFSTIQRYGANYVGTYQPNSNINLADTVHWHNTTNGTQGTGLMAFMGTPLINFVGATTTNLGTRLDATGLRIGQNQLLHNSNTAALQVDGTIKNGNQTLGAEHVNLTGLTFLSAVTATTVYVNGSVTSTTGFIKAGYGSLISQSSVGDYITSQFGANGGLFLSSRQTQGIGFPPLRFRAVHKM